MAEKTRFCDMFDCMYAVNKQIRENKGEDAMYCANSSNSAIISVFDGCGGLGAKTYDTFQGHTGAYIASRAVSGAIKQWYHENRGKTWQLAGDVADSMQQYINLAYDKCEPYLYERLRIRGSMVRKLPSTMALAFAQPDGDGVILHIIWAGDSRVYLMDEHGLAQLTLDDAGVEDAMKNLTSDSAMTNVLSADKNYHLNRKTVRLSKPAFVFAATDGCFGYIPSPMEFEYLVIRTMTECQSPDELKRRLYDLFSQSAGDDFSFGMMSFFMGDYQNCRNFLKPRQAEMKTCYVEPILADRESKAGELWEQYKAVYERYLRKDRIEQ